MTTPSFDIPKEAIRPIVNIVRRYNDLRMRLGTNPVDETSLSMDLMATHANGCPLDFAKLEAFDDFNLAHDCAGIQAHIDRTTGKLGGCFLPRCARHDIPEDADHA